MADGSNTGGLRVLIVDDHPTNRAVLETILGLIQAETRSVEDGAQAVQAYEAALYDLVLMDLQMPVMDGFDATRRIRELESQTGRPRTPIVVVSANSMGPDQQASKAAGADDHLAKPILPQALLDAITRALSPMTLH